MTEIRLSPAGCARCAGLCRQSPGMLALSGLRRRQRGPEQSVRAAPVTPAAAVCRRRSPTPGSRSLLTITGGAPALSGHSRRTPACCRSPRTSPATRSSCCSRTTSPPTPTVDDHGRRTLRAVQPVAPSQTVVVTVRASPLRQSITIVPTRADCGTAVCSGQTARPRSSVRGDAGRSACGRASALRRRRRAYAIVTNNPAQPLASTLTVVTDVERQRRRGPPVERRTRRRRSRMLRVTDVATGQQLIGNS